MDSRSAGRLTVLCWNIANPSVERAAKQGEWLRKRPEDVFVLTETKRSQGCALLERYFRAYGFNVIFPSPEGNEYGVMIASRLPLRQTALASQITYLPSRIASVAVRAGELEIDVIGTYVPSRDASPEKTSKKLTFLQTLSDALRVPASVGRQVFCGDLNILEPNHVPRYPFFEDFEYDFYRALITMGWVDAFRHVNLDAREYSWVGRTGDGYRFDHCFVSGDLTAKVSSCSYFHQPRFDKLSDHSALITELSLP